ncbi:unnamed protein product [Periconia digitata]|uniref:Uncharacterized protein n=1 Tax=Periconia digitata TaxID=1303443 RepID=A0A9W4U473_9PLEO|nr:unnamed protein product [Periconia digitata]
MYVTYSQTMSGGGERESDICPWNLVCYPCLDGDNTQVALLLLSLLFFFILSSNVHSRSSIDTSTSKFMHPPAPLRLDRPSTVHSPRIPQSIVRIIPHLHVYMCVTCTCPSFCGTRHPPRHRTRVESTYICYVGCMIHLIQGRK